MSAPEDPPGRRMNGRAPGPLEVGYVNPAHDRTRPRKVADRRLAMALPVVLHHPNDTESHAVLRTVWLDRHRADQLRADVRVGMDHFVGVIEPCPCCDQPVLVAWYLEEVRSQIDLRRVLTSQTRVALGVFVDAIAREHNLLPKSPVPAQDAPQQPEGTEAAQ